MLLRQCALSSRASRFTALQRGKGLSVRKGWLSARSKRRSSTLVTSKRPSSNELAQPVRGNGPTQIVLAGHVGAKLIVIGCIHAGKPNARALDVEGVAVDDGGLPDQVGG